MAQPKSDPHHAPKAPHGASVSLDKITAALQAAQQQLAQEPYADPWAFVPKDTDTSDSAGSQARASSAAANSAATAAPAATDTAGDAAMSDADAAMAAAFGLSDTPQEDTEHATDAAGAKPAMSDADAAMAAAFGLTDTGSASGDSAASAAKTEPAMSDADAAMAAAFGLSDTDIAADTASAEPAMSDADAAMAAAFGLSDADSAAGAASAMSDADAAMAAAFGLSGTDSSADNDSAAGAASAAGAGGAASAAGSASAGGAGGAESAMSDADAAMAAAFGLSGEGHISKEQDEPDDQGTTFSMEHALSDADAAMAAAFGLTDTQHNAIHSAGESLAAKIKQGSNKVHAVATPTMGADFEHAAEDIAMVSAHMHRIMDSNSDLDAALDAQDFDFSDPVHAGSAGTSGTGSTGLQSHSGDSFDHDEFDVSFEDDLLAHDAADLETTLTSKDEIAAAKARLALNASELEAIASYFQDVAEAGLAESQLRPKRRLLLSNGRRVPYPFVGEYHYYFEIQAPLEEEFISEDECGISTASNSRSILSQTLTSMGAVVRHFSNTSNYHLNSAQEWQLQLQVPDCDPIPVELSQISATSAGTGGGSGIVLKSSQPLEDQGLQDLSTAFLIGDEGKNDLVTHADLLKLLAQVVATDAQALKERAAEAHDGQGEQGEKGGPSHEPKAVQQHCPDLTSRLAYFVSHKKQSTDSTIAPLMSGSGYTSADQTTAPLACNTFVTGLRLEERSANSLELSPDLSEEQKKAVTSALSYDLSYIITGAQNHDTTLVRELILALMGQRKSVLVIDRDPANLHAIFRATEKSLQEQATMAEAYGDPSSALNNSYQDEEDHNKTESSALSRAATADAATNTDASIDAGAAAGAAGTAAAGDTKSDPDYEEFNLCSTERMALLLQRWHQDYPLLRLSADLTAVNAPLEPITALAPDLPEADGLSTGKRIGLESHLKQRLELLTQFGQEQQVAKEERLANLKMLLTHVKWIKESKLEELARNLKHLSSLKRQRMEHQNKLNHMHQAYEQQHELLLKSLTPQIVALRPENSTDSPQELTMSELMDFDYAPEIFSEVESEVKRLWQKIQDDQELYQELKRDIKERESIMRQVMYRALPRQNNKKYHRDNTSLSTVRGEYQQLVAQKDQLSSEYKDTTAKFNHLLLRLRFLKPQHQLYLKFEHLKLDNSNAVTELTAQINAQHEHNVQMFNYEKEWSERCNLSLKESEFNPQAWKELTSNFLEVKRGIASTQFLADNWRYVADGSLRHLLTATSKDQLSTSKDAALEEIQKAAALSRAAAAAGAASLSEEREAELSAPFEVNVETISQQLSKAQSELSSIIAQMDITPEQVAVARNALIAQCPVVGAVPHEAIAALKHSFNTVIINNAHQLLPIDFWLLTTLARERLVIIGDVMQMGGYAHVCGNSQSIRQQLYPSIFTLTGIKELLYYYQLSHNQAQPANEPQDAAGDPNGPDENLALASPALVRISKQAGGANVAATTATADSANEGTTGAAALSLPANVTLVSESETRPQELTALLNLFYAPFMTLSSNAEQQNHFLEGCEQFYKWSKLAPALQEHHVHLLDTAFLYPWMQEMTPLDYENLNVASLLRYDGSNVISAAYCVLLAFKLVSSLLICTPEEEQEAQAQGAGAGAGAGAGSDAAAGGSAASADLTDDIDALLAANSPAPAAAPAADDFDIDALLAANGGGAGASDSAGSSEEAEEKVFKPHLAASVLRDRINPENAAEPRVIIVSLYPQQALVIQLMVQQLYKQLGFTHDLNLIAVSDGATLSGASAPAVIFDLTIDAPYHNGLYFDAPHSDPAGNGLGAKREEFLQQHLCSAISAAQYGLFVVGDITRMLQRSQHANNAVFQMLKTMIVKMQLPLYDAQSALQVLTQDLKMTAEHQRQDSELSFKLFDSTSALQALHHEHEHNYSDRMHLMRRLTAMTTNQDEQPDPATIIQSDNQILGLVELLLRSESLPELDSATTLSPQESFSTQRLEQLQLEREVNIFGISEDSLRYMLHDMQSARSNVLIMSPLLDEVRYQSIKPQISALIAAGRRVMIMTLPLDLYPEKMANSGRVAVSNLKEMMVRVVFTKRCFYQGIFIDDCLMWLTTFTPLAQCTYPERAHEIMIRIAGSAALNYSRALHLPLVIRNLRHHGSCPICSSDLIFNAQHAQLYCQRYPQCGFMLTGSDELNNQGELLCPSCHTPMHLHIIQRADGKRGFALRCTKCDPPQIHGLSSSHLLLPYIRKQINATKGITMHEVQLYVRGKEKHEQAQRQKLEAELEAASTSNTTGAKDNEA